MTDTSNTRTENIVISGVGGQGVLTLAEIMARTALQEGRNVRVGEIHGMAQRGGHVVCTVRIGAEAYGPIVDHGTAQLIIGFEPIETLREIHLLHPDGFVILNSHVQHPVAVSMGKAEYPPDDVIRESIRMFTTRFVEFDALELARQAGSSRSMNMVMFGASVGTGLVPVSASIAENVVAESFPERFREVNVRAFRTGLKTIRSLMR